MTFDLTRSATKPVAPTSYDIAGVVSVTSAITTIAMSTGSTTQVGSLMVVNVGSIDVYLSPSPTMTTGDAPIILPAIPPGGTIGGIFKDAYGGALYGRTVSGTASLRVLRTVY